MFYFRKQNNIKFYKLNEIFDQFNFNIKSAFKPYKRLCIDETLYACRCRCSIIQYIPSKPACYGLKYNCLVDVATSYLLETKIYLGN